MNLLIRNVSIVDAEKNFYGDVHLKEGQIVRIYHKGDYQEDLRHFDGEIIEGKGLTLLPSFVDMHCHLRDPGFLYKEDLETGQRAALKGGFTTLCAMANTKPVCDNKEVLKYVLNKSQALGLCDVIQVSALTEGLEGKKMTDFQENLKLTSLFSDDGYTVLSDEIMGEALRQSKALNFRILTHCEPEFEIVDRDLNLLRTTGGNLHICHISLKKTLDRIKTAKKEGLAFTCEVTPHHLFGSDLDYKVNPSFRSEGDVKALIEGIKEGAIDIIGTDHAPHSLEDKEKGAPGISLIEVAFSMVYKVFMENNLSINKLSQMMSYKPSKLLGLNSGLIKEGYQANLVLVDLEESYKIDSGHFVSKGKNNPFTEKRVKGRIKLTIKDGRIVYRDEGKKAD